MSFVEQARDGREPGGGTERGVEHLAVGVVRVLLEVVVAAPAGDVPPRADAGEPELLDQVVVLEEADEDAGEHPGDRALHEQLIAPGRLGERGAPRLLGRRVLGGDRVADRSVLVRAET